MINCGDYIKIHIIIAHKIKMWVRGRISNTFTINANVANNIKVSYAC